MDRVIRIVSCCREGRKNEKLKKVVASLTRTSSVISVIEVSEEFWEDKARFQEVKWKQSHI